MINKNDLIEKLNNIIGEEYSNSNFDWFDIADKISNNLFTEDIVILSKEEFDDLSTISKRIDDQTISEISKETAEKIYLQAKAIVNATKHIVQGREYLHLDALKEIIKSCGLEIKE